MSAIRLSALLDRVSTYLRALSGRPSITFSRLDSPITAFKYLLMLGYI